jgi:tRNA dimethylallyltransferase
MGQEKKIILLAGPTSSGKSKLAIQLAKNIKGEIINADSMQVYKEISILNSKPTIEDFNIVGHHLYGFLSSKKRFSSGVWLKMAIKKIEVLWKKNLTPILVGGTGLYFKVLTDGLVQIPDIPIKLKKEILKMHNNIGQKAFFAKLVKLDPLVKNSISPSDSQRSIRAYQVKKFTKKSLIIYIKQTKPLFTQKVFKKLFINTPRELLHNKIEKRVEYMFELKVLEEVKNFLKLRVRKDLSANKIIGVKEIGDYLDGKVDIFKTKQLIIQKTRQYAKRQFTWSRGHMTSWDMIYSSNFNDLFKKALNKIF